MRKKMAKKSEIERDRDAWPRFEQFVRDVARAGSKHRIAKPKARPASKGRVRKGSSRA
jgi:hypothetical protein